MRYRFLYLDTFGHIVGGMDCDAAEDLDALETAQKAVHKGPLEIWTGERCVARLKPDGNAYQAFASNRSASAP